MLRAERGVKMAKNCWLVFNEDGYLVCTTNHNKPWLCDLYEKEDAEQESVK